MKIKLVLILSICIVGVSYAQVGINTEDPQGMLHVKGTVTDVVVEEGTGNVGIGTLDPQEKLHVVGDVNISGNSASSGADIDENTYIEGKAVLGGTISPSSAKLEIITNDVASGVLIDGDASLANKVFVSDAQGIAGLRDFRSEFVFKEGTVSHNKLVSNGDDTSLTFVDISDDLVLTEGKWLILAKCVIFQPSNSGQATGLYERAGKMRLTENGSIINEVSTVAQRRGYRIASPEIVQYVHIPTGTRNYRLSAFISTANNDTNTGTTTAARAGRGCVVSNDTKLGNQYFVAVRLAKD